jgi:hypothetical protein
MLARITAILLLLMGCALCTAAAAQEYCVVCFDPPARYRCMVGADPGTAPSPSRSQFVCITELARTGQHASCTVGRNNAEPCDGNVQTVFVPSTSGAPLPPELQAQDPVAPSPAPSEETAQMPGEPPATSDAPPETVEELAKKTVEASGKGLKKAGEAVSDTAKSAGDAASKTWKCLSSLFSDC